MKQAPHESHSSQRASKIFKISFFILIAILTVFHFDLKKIDAAAIGDGVFIYDQTTPTTNVQSRIWIGSTTDVSAASSPFAGSGVSKHVYAKGSPTRVEMLLGIQDAAGLLTIYKSIDYGVTWVSQWTATVGDGNLKRFEIAYEQTSGDALVVYSSNVGTTNEMKYQTWNGTAWSGALNLDAVRTTGTVYGIRAAERNNSNEIGIVWSDTNLDLSANLWTGTAWYGERSTVLETSLSKIGTATVPTNRAYDLAFESLSGDLMVTWGTDALADAKYVIKTAGGAWGTTATATPMAEEPTMIDIAPSPISDKIAYVNCTDNGGDCDFIVWSGSAWGTNLNDAASGTPIVGDSGNNVDWLVDGTNEVAIFTYNDSTTTGLDWVTSVNGATPIAQTDDTIAPAIIGSDRAGFSKVNPGDSSEGVFIFENSNADIFIKRVYLFGTTVLWYNPALAAIETNASVTGYNPVGFAFVRFVNLPPTVGLNNPADTTSTEDTTPTLNFTGTDTNNDAVEYEVQVDTVNTFDSTSVLQDSYNESNATINTAFYPALNSTSMIAQSFTATGGVLDQVKFILSKQGSPGGSSYATVYSHTGTYGTSSLPGTPLAVAAIDVTTLTTTPTLTTFTFTGSNRINLTTGNYYTVVFDSNTGDSTNKVLVGIDGTAPLGHSGNNSRYNYTTQNWTADTTSELIFYVYAKSSAMDAFSTTNPGFTAGHPFSSGVAKEYTVQSPLAQGTYYWRVKAKDPLGSGTYGVWSNTSSFNIISICTATTTGLWNTGGNWTGCSGAGGIPGAGDETVINTGVTITQNINTPILKSLTINGTLNTINSGTSYNINSETITLGTLGTLTANNSTINLSGTTGTLFTKSTGTFNAGTSTVNLTSVGNQGVWTMQPNSPAASFGEKSLASSSDGTKLAAAGYNNYIYTSTDSGVNWSQPNTLLGNWNAIASSADGTKLAAGGYSYIYTSTNSGLSWTAQTNSGSLGWKDIASSSDGTKLAVAVGSNYILTSVNSGVNWTSQTNSGSRAWYTIASSSDGTKLVAGVNGGYIYTSTDSGATWVERTTSGSRAWYSIASSSDGTKLAASAKGGYIYTSTDSGVNWTQQTNSGSRDWYSIASSSDGTKLAAVIFNGYIYISTDSGANWAEQTSVGLNSWDCIESSSDGSKLVATNGDIYTYVLPLQNATLSSGNPSFYNLTITGGGTRLLSEALTVTNDLTITGGTLDTTALNHYNVSAGRININGGTFTPQSSTVNLNGISGVLFTLSSGTFTAGTSTINLTGNGDAIINSGSPTYYNLTSSGTGTKTLGGALTLATGGTLNVSAGTFNPSSYLVTGSGTNTLLVSSGATLGVGAATFAGNYSAGFATKTLSSGSTVDYLNGYQTIDSGVTYSNLNTSVGGTKTLGGYTTVTGILTIGAGSTLAGNSYNLELSVSSGIPFVNNGTFQANTSTVIYTGGVNTLYSGYYLSYYNLNISGTGTILLGQNLVVTTDLTISGGTLDTTAANHYNVSAGRIIINGGTFKPQASTVDLMSTGTVFNYISGTFMAGTSTIKLTNSSSAEKTFAGGGQTYNNLWLAPTTGTGSFTISGSNTFNNFKDDGIWAHSILFATGSTQTISTWNVSGSGNLITINSTDTGTHTLNLVGAGAFADSDYLNIQHSIATPADTWYAGANSVNNQNVATIGSGWIFTPRLFVSPTVTTQAVTNIDATTATGNGNITNTGGENNTKRGFVYGTLTQSLPGNVFPGSSGYATYSEDTGSFTAGAFTKNLTGLTLGITYFVRAYAYNSVGYSYGGEVSFTTAIMPRNITISTSATTCTGTPNFTTTNSDCIVLNTDIQTLINAGNNVSLTASGSITVSNVITKSSGADVTMNMYASENIIISADITSTVGKLGLLLNADRDANTSGYINVSGALTSNGGDITLGGGSGTISNGSGFAIGNAGQAYGIYVNNKTVSAAGGNIIANGQGYSSVSSSSIGIYVTNSAIITTGNGTINITGKGKGVTGSGGSHVGLSLRYGSVISTFDGNLTINNSTGGNGGIGVGNYGVSIEDINSTIKTTGAGNISITGTGGFSTTSTGRNYGINCAIINCIQTTGTGTMTLTGSGGTGGIADGIYVSGSISGNGGSMTINGTGGGSSNFNNNKGLEVNNGAISNIGSGTLSITGNGGGFGSSTANSGVAFAFAVGGVISTVDGNLTINGIGGNGTGSYNDGVSPSQTIKTTGSGNLIINGTKGANSASSYGVLAGSGLLTTGSGNITVNTNTISIGSINSIGSLAIAPYTASGTIGVAGGAGTLALSSTDLGNLTYGTGLTIGNSSQTGTTTVGAYSGWTKPIKFAHNGTGSINITGAQTNTSSFNFDGPTNLTVDITASALTIASGTFNAGAQTIDLTGAGGFTNSGNFTAGTSTIKFTDTSNSGITFSGGGRTYGNIYFNRGASTGSNTISGSNTFNNFKDDGTVAHSILFTTGSTQTISTWNVSGSSGNLKTINSTDTGIHTLNLVGVGAIADSDYLNIQHSIATPANTWYAGTHSVNNQNVASIGSGWIFTAVPSGATYIQSGYRWFNNQDDINVGSALSSLNTFATLNNSGDNFRLRLLTHIGGNLLINGQNFKLQYADKVGQCDVAFSGESYSDITNNTNISYYNNFYPEDKVTLASNANDPTHGSDVIVPQSYVESNNFSNSISALSTGQDGLWDFSLYDKDNANNVSYCFRIVKDDGSVLDGYSFIPEIITAFYRSRGGGGVHHIESVATPNPIQNGGTNQGGGGQGFTACSDGIDNDSDTFIDSADSNCHSGGNISAAYVPTHDSETISPGVSNGGGTDPGGGGGSGDLGYFEYKLTPFFIFRNYLFASVFNFFNTL